MRPVVAGLMTFLVSSLRTSVVARIPTGPRLRRNDVLRWAGEVAVVHQMVIDYQNQENGGNGFLRVMQFAGSEKPVHVWDYSPHLNAKSQIPNTDFQL